MNHSVGDRQLQVYLKLYEVDIKFTKLYKRQEFSEHFTHKLYIIH